MEIDITKCIKPNVIDSCAIWNILSSLVFYSVVLDNKFDFCITRFVEYECIKKARKNASVKELELADLLKKQMALGKFPVHALTLEDLQHEEIINLKNRLGKGELSSIAFAIKTGIAFLTDDKGARKRSKTILGNERVQTSPHIVGWLHYKGLISDTDLEDIIKDHVLFERPLEKFFREVHAESHKMKYMDGLKNAEPIV